VGVRVCYDTRRDDKEIVSPEAPPAVWDIAGL
jgi:hypothetical protein